MACRGYFQPLVGTPSNGYLAANTIRIAQLLFATTIDAFTNAYDKL